MAVLDGLGGSGAAVVATAEGEQSQARIAAGLAREVVWQFVLAAPRPDGELGGASDLGQQLRDRLAAAVNEYGIGASKLRSKLIRTLPTTLALGRYRRTAAGTRCEAIWAGDSRVYLLTPEHGLQQLSDDDLRSGGDAMENLSQDSPLSNLINTSVGFVLHSRGVVVPPGPVVLLAATDGCFGYVPTPWHFEHLLLQAMRDSESAEQWRDEILRRIGEVTGDDASLGMAVIGAPSFGDLKPRFGWRAAAVGELTHESDLLRRWLDQQRQELARVETRFDELHTGQWTGYRPRYEYWLANAAKRTTSELAPPGGPGAATGGPAEGGIPERSDGYGPAPRLPAGPSTPAEEEH